ncbi:aldehyde dehydrogenase family protein [Leekyejoonella antrihumi]|uniref:aldehyde dehydrogenase family protein n=1 Tax=Leekyejoonella antrihumi TaxID=1660198 RepID=UPI001C93A374
MAEGPRQGRHGLRLLINEPHRLRRKDERYGLLWRRQQLHRWGGRLRDRAAAGRDRSAASAWTHDVFRAQRAARQIQAGTVWINDHIPIISEMPHGGVKASGYGKDMSAYSLDEYTQVRHIMSDITGAARKPWHEKVFRA